MSRLKRRLKKTNRFFRYSYYLLIIAYLLTYVFFVLSLINLHGIETILRIIVIVFFFLWFLLFGCVNLLKLLQKKYKSFSIMALITIIFMAIFVFSSSIINTIYGNISNISENEDLVYTTYLVKLKDSEFNNDSVIGRVENEFDTEGYVLTKELIKKEDIKNKIVSYDDYLVMLSDLMDKKIDAVFLPRNYGVKFANIEGYEQIESITEVIKQYSKEMENKNTVLTSNKDFNEPLTFLVMGVDSEHKGLKANAAFNGDTLMLVSINPKTLDVLVVSIPRDTYVPISCNKNKYSKINSAAVYGTNCVIETVSNFLDIPIDYYVKINFKGVVELVDAVGGIEVEVEKPDFNYYNGVNYGGKMCEQNSDREFGDSIICIDPGWQKLNGEQALAYARNRYLYIGGDLDRIVHQQQILEALSKKLVSFASLSDFQNILSAISNNIATNMATNKIMSGYEVVKSIALNALNNETFININKAYLETYSLSVYLPSGIYASAQAYYNDSLEDIQNELKILLDIKKREPLKTFSYSMNESYSLQSPGQGLRKVQSLSLMPNLIGSNVSKAEDFCKNNGIKLNIVYVNQGEAHYNAELTNGLIGDQSVMIGTLLNNVSELTIYISNQPSKEEVEQIIENILGE